MNNSQRQRLLYGQPPEYPNTFPKPPFNLLSMRETQLAILNYKAFRDNLKFYIEETSFILEEEEPEARTVFRSNLRMARSILRDVKMNIDLLNDQIARIIHRHGTPEHRSPWSLLPIISLSERYNTERYQHTRTTRSMSTNSYPSRRRLNVATRGRGLISTRYSRHIAISEQTPLSPTIPSSTNPSSTNPSSIFPRLISSNPTSSRPTLPRAITRATIQPSPARRQPIDVIDLTGPISIEFASDGLRVFVNYLQQTIMLEILFEGDISTCMICGENRQTISFNNKLTKLPCNHVCCLHCLQEWIESCFDRNCNATCPLCRDIIFEF